MKNGLDHEDYWLLTPVDEALIEAKSRANRLGFGVLLVFFRDRGRFPRIESEIDGNWVKKLASRFNLEGALDYATIINGRTAERYRAEIRLRFGFREATVNDADMLTDWLCDHAVADAFGDFEKLFVIFELRCRNLLLSCHLPTESNALDDGSKNSTTASFAVSAWTWHQCRPTTNGWP